MSKTKFRPLHDRLVVRRITALEDQGAASSFPIAPRKSLPKAKSSPSARAAATGPASSFRSTSRPATACCSANVFPLRGTDTSQKRTRRAGGRALWTQNSAPKSTSYCILTSSVRAAAYRPVAFMGTPFESRVIGAEQLDVLLGLVNRSAHERPADFEHLMRDLAGSEDRVGVFTPESTPRGRLLVICGRLSLSTCHS